MQTSSGKVYEEQSDGSFLDVTEDQLEYPDTRVTPVKATEGDSFSLSREADAREVVARLFPETDSRSGHRRGHQT